MANGHNYLEVVEHYTMEEIQAFYRACLRMTQERMKSDAIAARVGGATEKGFKQFINNIDKSIGTIEKATPRPKKPKRRDDDAFKSFFGQVSKLPTAAQAQKAADKARRDGRSAEEVRATDLDGTTTIPVRYHKRPPPQ